MSPRWPSTREFTTAATLAARRFPWSLATAVGFAVLLTVRQDPWVSFDGRWGILPLTLLVALPAFTALTLFWERRAATQGHAAAALAPLAQVLKVLLPGLAWAALFHVTVNAFPEGGAQYVRTAHAVALGLIALPVAWQGGGLRGRAAPATDDLVLWHFVKLLVFWAIAAWIFSSVLLGGIVGAAKGLETLFKVPVPQLFYERSAQWVLTVLPVWIYLAGMPNQRDGFTDFRFPAILQKFAQYILAPLTIVYLALLYPYAVKILVTRTWPSGVVSPLVMAETGLAFACAALLFPNARQDSHPGLRKLARVTLGLSAPLLVMLLLALAQRIGDHGLTESRFYLGLFGAWALGVAIAGAVSLSLWIGVLAPSLFGLAVLTWVGPLSATYWGERWQTERVVATLKRNNLLDAQGKASIKASPDTAVPFADLRALSSGLDYLESRHGGRSIHALFPLTSEKDKAEPLDSQRAQALLKGIGLRYVNPWDSEDNIYFSFRMRESDVIPVVGYEGAYALSLYRAADNATSKDERTLTWEGHAVAVDLMAPGILQVFVTPKGSTERELLVLPLAEAYGKAKQFRGEGAPDADARDRVLPASVLAVSSESPAGWKVAFYPTVLSGSEKDGQVVVNNAMGTLLLGRVPASPDQTPTTP